MGKIVGNDNDFPTIKQVNDVLTGGSEKVFDVSMYGYAIMQLSECSNYQQHNNNDIMNICTKINNGDYTRIKCDSGTILDCPINIIGNYNKEKYLIFEWQDNGSRIYKTSLSLTNDNYKTIISELSPY